jgi:hypothetical protein
MQKPLESPPRFTKYVFPLRTSVTKYAIIRLFGIPSEKGMQNSKRGSNGPILEKYNTLSA